MSSAWRVVTVGREYGSGGAAVAAALAQRLRFRLLDRALIERIAEAASIDPALAERLDEHVDGWATRVARALRFGGFESVAAVPGEAILDAERMQALSAAVIEEAASAGECVIVGRGAQCLLHGQEDAFHVFVYAPRDDRMRRLRARLGREADVETLMDETDRERAAYVRRHFGCDWLDHRLYHLLVNAALGEAAAVALIAAALEHSSPRRP
jgi:cytidylate kinase